MKNNFILLCALCVGLLTWSCKDSGSSTGSADDGSAGLKIAYINGDSILLNFNEFRKESEAMEVKQKKAEADLQSKGAALEREIKTYQQRAQAGTMTGKEMEAQERYLGSRQEAVYGERDRMAQEIMEETSEINKRLKDKLNEKLAEIQKKEGYDFILSYVEGGSILMADPKYDITDQVLKMLNGKVSAGKIEVDTMGKK